MGGGIGGTGGSGGGGIVNMSICTDYENCQQQQQQNLENMNATSESNFTHSTMECGGHYITSTNGKSRMMVSKIWNSCFPEFAGEHQVKRHNFYLCQWQRNTQVRIIYLLYRWLTAITCLAVLVCSLMDIGRTEEQYEHHYAKWWIYLTHWGILFCAIQAWFAAWIVTNGLMVDRDDFEIVRHMNKSYFHSVYWILYTLATVYSFIITFCYWCLVHDPEIHKVDTLNIMVHVFNSVIMLIDLAIVGHPIKLSHAYYTTGTGVGYAIFTGVYFLAGGTDRKNRTTIYPLLDWTKPGKSIVVTACGILFVFIVHFICYALYRLRVCLFTKLCVRHPHNDRDSADCDDDGGGGHHHMHDSSSGGGDCLISSGTQQQQQQHILQQPQSQQQYHHQIQQQQYSQYPQHHQDNNNKDNKMSSLSRTVAALESSQREQLLNPNKILEYKM